MTSGHRSCNIIINRKLLETISQMSQNCESFNLNTLRRVFFQLCSFSSPVPGPYPVRPYGFTYDRGHGHTPRARGTAVRAGGWGRPRRGGATRSSARPGRLRTRRRAGPCLPPPRRRARPVPGWGMGLGLGIGLGIGSGIGSGLGRLGEERDRYRLGRRETHADHQ